MACRATGPYLTERGYTMKGMINSFIGKFTVLKGAPRELWIIYAAKLLEIIAYGLISPTLVLWLSSDLGFNDVNAGYIIAVWSTLISLFTVLVGSLTDAIGIRKAFIFGFVVCLVTRIVMVVTATKWVVMSFGLLPLALGEALMVPVMVAGVRRYSSTKQRSMAFSLFYTLMNVGFAIAGWLFDYIRTTLGEHGTYVLPLLNMPISTYRSLFVVSVLATIVGLILIYTCMREGVEATDDGVTIEPAADLEYDEDGLLEALYRKSTETIKHTGNIFKEVCRHPTFLRFMLFLTLVVGVRLIFYHMHYTFPKYGLRELGEGAPIGRLFGMLNPVLIVILVPIVGALSQKISAYKMITVGSFITGISVFFMAMPPQWFAGIADGWFGHLVANTWLGVQGPVNPLYASIALSVIVLSVGEALWSPRLYEYTAAIAPKGQEASYMAFSILPFFVAKFFVGSMSGLMLQRYCPAEGPRDSEMMWLLIGCMTMLTPLGLVVFKKYIQVKESGRD